MLGGSSFLNDPFFASHRESMQQMDRLMDSHFGGAGSMLALPAGHRDDRRRQRQQQQQAQNMQISRQDMFMDPFAHFDNMFSGMRSMMADMHRAFDQGPSNPDGQMYQQSSFMSYSNHGTNGGAPKVFQATSSMRQGPCGIRETTKSIRDSESGVEKMAVGRHINDRGHVIERSRNQKSGEKNENQEYINIGEEDAESFGREYQEKWHSTMRGVDQRRHTERSRHAPVGDGRRPRYALLAEPAGHHRPRKVSYRRD